MQSPLIPVSRRVIPSGFLGMLLVFFWMLYIHLANVQPISLDAKMLTPEWQSLYMARLPVSLLLIGTTIFQWWSKSSRSHQEQDKEKGLSKLFYSRSFYFLLTFLTILSCRWNTLAGYEFNYDASQSITAARTLFHDPRFWISVDVGTHGPAVSFPQLILPLCGFAIDYASSRLLGIFLLFVSVICIFVILRRFASETTARLILIPSIFVVSALRFSDFVEFNGEHPIVFYMMLSLACITSAFYPKVQTDLAEPDTLLPEQYSLMMLFFGGVFLGIIPWAKIQGLPFCATLFILGGLGCIFANRSSGEIIGRRKLWRRLSYLTIGSVTPTFFVLSFVAYNNALPLMFDSYIRWNLIYAKRDGSSLIAKLLIQYRFLAHFFLGSTSFHTLLQPIILFALFAHFRLIKNSKLNFRSNLLFVIAGLLLFVAIISIIAPGNQFPHYLLLALFPLCLIYSVFFMWLFRLTATENGVSTHKGAIIFMIGGIFLPFVFWGFVPSRFGTAQLTAPFTIVYPFDKAPRAGAVVDTSELVSTLSTLVEPEDYIGIWGWRPKIFVLSNTLSATRSSVNMREAIRELPMNDYFCDLFLQDLKLKRPRVFVDNSHRYDFTVLLYKGLSKANPTWPKRTYADFQYENYPQLKEWIDSNYTLYVKVDSGVRIFTRKDLAIPRKTTLSK